MKKKVSFSTYYKDITENVFTRFHGTTVKPAHAVTSMEAVTCIKKQSSK